MDCEEQGTYLYPQGYRQPESKGRGYARQQMNQMRPATSVEQAAP